MAARLWARGEPRQEEEEPNRSRCFGDKGIIASTQMLGEERAAQVKTASVQPQLHSGLNSEHFNATWTLVLYMSLNNGQVLLPGQSLKTWTLSPYCKAFRDERSTLS